MSRVLTLATQDLRLTLRDKSSYFWIFIAPILWVSLFSVISAGGNPSKTRLSIQILQSDDSPVADRFASLLQGENFDVEVVKPGHPAKEGSSPSRILTIPAGFGDAIAARKKIVLDLEVKSSANTTGTFAMEVALHRAIVRLLASEALGPLDPADDAVTVKSSYGSSRAIPAGVYQSLPGNLVMFVLIAPMTYGAAILARERRQGLLRRLGSTPASRTEILAGKMAGRALIAALQVLVFIVLGLTVFRLEFGSSPIGLALLLGSFCLAAACLSLLLGTLFTSEDATSGVGVVASLMMSAAGGCWWPAEVSPRWMQVAGHAFPTAWAMDGLHGVISWGGGVPDVLLPCAALLVMAAAAGAAAVTRIRIAA